VRHSQSARVRIFSFFGHPGAHPGAVQCSADTVGENIVGWRESLWFSRQSVWDLADCEWKAEDQGLKPLCLPRAQTACKTQNP